MIGPDGVFIALGSNMGDRDRHLKTALAELHAESDIEVVEISSFHETEPEGGPVGQSPYLNAAARITTALNPHALLKRLQAIEAAHGRVRSVPNGPRPLDLDLLLYYDELIDEPGLIVPHPRMWQRPFVMDPLAEICDVDQLIAIRGKLMTESVGVVAG